MEITTFKEAYIKELQENKDYLFSKEEAERTATKMIDAAELQSLSQYIAPEDVQLLEWADIPEYNEV